MALNSERFESVVNPDKGIYVEMEGVMEVRHSPNIVLSQSDLRVKVRYSSDDPDYYHPPEPEDFKDFQERIRSVSILFRCTLSTSKASIWLNTGRFQRTSARRTGEPGCRLFSTASSATAT